MGIADTKIPDKQPYKLSGKEYITTRGLNLYDFGARMHDPAAMRFSTPDPLMEQYPSLSPYTYCAANPMKYIDPTGRKLKFANATDNDIQNILEILNRSVCGLATFSYDSTNNEIAFSFNSSYNRIDTSAPGYYAASFMSLIIESLQTTIINIFNDSDIIIGDALKHAIDLNDILRLGKEGYANDFGALIHECFEQYLLQKFADSEITDEILFRAHQRAIGAEGNLFNISINWDRQIIDDYIFFKYIENREEHTILIKTYDKNVIDRR